MSISEPAGGVVPITVVAVIFTGILGSILAPTLIKIFHVKDSVAAGLAIGACSHAVGTSKAIEIGAVFNAYYVGEFNNHEKNRFNQDFSYRNIA